MIESIVKSALAVDYANVFRRKPKIIDVTHALSGASPWKEAIRDLCRAKIAFMNLSNYKPGIMMPSPLAALAARLTRTFQPYAKAAS